MSEPATVLHIATGTLLAVADPWAVLEWLPHAGPEPEYAARCARWDDLQKRQHSAGAKKGEQNVGS